MCCEGRMEVSEQRGLRAHNKGLGIVTVFQLPPIYIYVINPCKCMCEDKRELRCANLAIAN